jgi:predicted dehydrogenase
MNLGIIGYGYWGPNIVRNFSMNPDVNISMICDIDQNLLNKAACSYKNIGTTHNYLEITRSKDIDAVAIVTPVFTHYEIAKSALENGKHIFIEKPFTSNTKQAEELIELAGKKNLIIMVDHTFLFTGAVKKIKELIDSHELGDIYYYDAMRVNLGLFQHDVNVIWDLAPHDFSIMDYLLNEKPVSISATGLDHFNRNLEDVAYVTVFFQSNLIAHFNVNWLSPVKIRSTLLGGSKKMLVWNDLETDEKLKIYDKGVDIKTREGVYNLLINYRSGDMYSPRVTETEALRLETEYFINCIKSNQQPFNNGHAGLRNVRILEATTKSLRNKGKEEKLIWS